MTLQEIKDDILAGLSATRPNQDLGIPDAVIYFWIASESAALMEMDRRRRRANSIAIEPYMLMTVPDLEPTIVDGCPKTCPVYEVESPTPIMNLPEDAGFSSARIYGGIEIGIVDGATINTLSKIEDAAPSHESPVAYRVGPNKIYMEGGTRDFSKVKVCITIVPDGTSYDPTDCDFDLSAPIPSYLVSDLTKTCITRGLAYRNGGFVEVIDDGRPDDKTKAK